MNTLTALYGSRMGRKVEDPATVIAECEKLWSKNSHDTHAVETPGEVITPAIGQHPSELGFYFFGIPYQGGIVDCLFRPLKYLDNGEEKTPAEHLKWLADRQNHPVPNWTVPDLELEYQLARTSFNLKDHPRFGKAAKKYLKGIGERLEQKIVTSDSIGPIVTGIEVTIQNKSGIGHSQEKRYVHPGVTLYQLSTIRPVGALRRTSPINANIAQVLNTIFGSGYEEAGIVFSYLCSRTNRKLVATNLFDADADDTNDNVFTLLKDGDNLEIDICADTPGKAIPVVALPTQPNYQWLFGGGNK